MQARETKQTAILVDGGFYRARAMSLWKRKSAKERAAELFEYCMKHITDNADKEPRDLYRIFYYDCPPMSRIIKHPLTGVDVDYSTLPGYTWTNEFFDALTRKRKLALRRGELAESQAFYTLKAEVLPKLLDQTKAIADLTEKDFYVEVKQKGVDMRIGLDVASLANGGVVNQIILIAGDSDFVPVAKLARRSGMDVLLDPMKQHIKASLSEHIDGIESFC